MAESTQDYLYPNPQLRPPSKLLPDLGGNTAAAALGLAGALAAVLLFSAPLIIAILGGITILALSFMESEAFLLLIIFLTPLGWILSVDLPGHDVPVALRFLVIVGFFAGKLSRGQARLRNIFRPALSRASLWFLCLVAATTIIGHKGLTHESVRDIYVLGTFVGFYFVVLAWVETRERLHKVLWVVLTSTLVTAIFAIYQQIIGGYGSLWLYVTPVDAYFRQWAGRSASFLGDPNSLAGYLNLVLPFALACSLLGRRRWKKLGAWTLGLGFVALLSSQSLGGFLGFGSILVLAIINFVPNARKRILLLCGLGAFTFLLYLLRGVINPIHTEQAISGDAIGRLLLWQTAIQNFISSPIIGVGWGNFVGPFGPDYPAFLGWDTQGLPSAHSTYLQLLAETGILGFSAFFWLVIKAWREGRERFRSSDDVLIRTLGFGVLGAILSLLVQGIADFLFQGQFGTLLWIILGLLAASSRLTRTPHEPNKSLCGA